MRQREQRRALEAREEERRAHEAREVERRAQEAREEQRRTPEAPELRRSEREVNAQEGAKMSKRVKLRPRGGEKKKVMR